MGFSYSHGIFVADLTWRPRIEHVDRVHEVLLRWGFVSDDPLFFRLGEAAEELEELGTKLPPNLLASYDGCEGDVVAKLLGPSAYDGIADADRYIVNVLLCLGVDLRVVQAESFDVEVLVPPRNGKTPVPLDEMRPDPGHSLCYPASWSTTPPTAQLSTRAEIAERVASIVGRGNPRSPAPPPKTRPAFTGVWRSGLVIDCDKDVPAIASDLGDVHLTGFRDELEAAFGTKLVEQGWLH